MAARDLIDGGYRIAYRVAYPLAKHWWRWRGLNGCAIAVWHNDQVLAVLHSYKPGWRLPGGGVKRGEDPRIAAVRELHEETNVTVDPADVQSVAEHTNRYGRRSIFAVELHVDPALKVNQREIISAAFVAPIALTENNAQVRCYLRMRALAKTVVIADHHG